MNHHAGQSNQVIHIQSLQDPSVFIPNGETLYLLTLI